jgi:lysozyme family protein
MGTAVKILQTAANSVYPQDSMIELLVDGIWGPATLHDVNACDPSALVSAFDAARVAHLKKYDANSPYLAQLIARAEK